MKTPTIALILGAVLSLFSVSAVAQVEAEWRLFDVGTGDEYILANGTRLDIYRFDVDRDEHPRGVHLGLHEPHHGIH